MYKNRRTIPSAENTSMKEETTPMKMAKEKLNSRSGATMLLALVFFLLCTVLASILLVASSAGSGRLGGIADNDARYYAVSSAAGLLRDGLENKPVTVKLTKRTVTTTVTPYTVKNDGTTEKGTPVSTPTHTYSAVFSDAGDERPAVRGDSLLSDLALDLAAGTGIVNAQAAWTYGGLTGPQTRKLEISPSFDEALKVSADAVLESDGRLRITVSSAGEDEDSFNLVLTFSADIQTESSRDAEQGTSSVAKNSETSFTETVVSESTETKTVTVCWTLTGVERISS